MVNSLSEKEKIVKLIEEKIQKAIKWLWSVRNPDYGWGDSPNRLTDLSGCAEVMLGMVKAGVNPSLKEFQQSLSYLKKEFSKPLSQRAQEQWSPRTLAWPILFLTEVKEPIDSLIIQQALKDLERFRIKNEGYSTKIGDKSNVFDTSLAILCLNKDFNRYKSSIEEIINWLKLTQNKDGGWPFYKGKESNSICTAMAIIALIEIEKSFSLKPISKALDWLLSNQKPSGEWNVCLEEQAIFRYGKWIHYSSPWAIVALLKANLSPYSEEVHKGIKAILKYQEENGGWKILPEYPAFNHATGHALYCLGEYLKKISEIR